MIEKKISKQHQATFDGIRHTYEAGNEFWLARELAKVLEYSQYRHFLPVLERAAEACRNSGQRVQDHMEEVLTMVDIGSGAQRSVEDVRLSRYACCHPVRPEPVEGLCVVRQAHHERGQA